MVIAAYLFIFVCSKYEKSPQNASLKIGFLGKLNIKKPHCSLMRMSATKNL